MKQRMKKNNKYGIWSVRILLIFWGIVCLFFILPANAAPLASNTTANQDIKTAKELLDSWSGQTERLNQAKAILTHVLDVDPKNYVALKEMARYQIMAGYINSKNTSFKGNVYSIGNFKPGTLDKAEALIRQALSINKKFAEGYILLSHIQFNQSKLTDAENSLKLAESLKTKDPWLYLNRADIHEARAEHSAAEKRWRQVLQSGTDNKKAMLSAYEFLINSYKKSGQHEKAVALYKEQIQKYPDNAWLRGNFASYLSDTLNRNDEAVTEARAALKVMDYGIGHRILATALYRKWADMVAAGEAFSAEKYFREAYEYFPNLAEVMAYGAATSTGEKLAKALIIQKQISVDSTADDGSTALLIATNHNRVQVVRTLLNLNANPNISNTNGWTPLLSAVDEGNMEIVKMLLAKGADINAKLKSGNTAFALAKLKGHEDIFQLLTKSVLNSQNSVLQKLH